MTLLKYKGVIKMQEEEIYDIENFETEKSDSKDVSKLVKLAGGITITALAVLSLSGCMETYNRYPYRPHRRTVIVQPRYRAPPTYRFRSQRRAPQIRRYRAPSRQRSYRAPSRKFRRGRR